MSLTTILSEVWRFIKKNIIKILIGSIIISILVVIIGQFLPNLMNKPSTTRQSENGDSSVLVASDQDIAESRDFLTKIYAQEPAEFEIYTQLTDGTVFPNSFIFDEYFTSPKVVETVESRTGVDYGQTLAHERTLNLYKTSQYRGSIAGIRDTSSNVITIRVQAAQSSEENLELAETFLEMINNNEVPFIQDMKVTIISEPSVGEKLIENDLNMVSSPAALGTITTVETGSTSFILKGIAGFIIGLLITTILLFLIQLFKSKIDYAFQYSWDFNDQHYLYNRTEDNKKLTNMMSFPKTNNHFIVHQNSSFVENLIDSNQSFKESNTLFNNSQYGGQEIIIFVESGVTDKDWYNEQYRLAEMSNGQIRIVHLIN